MIAFLALVAGRLAVTMLALATWAYTLTTYSTFAYDMFVRPRLFPWLEHFVAWHHLWALAAYVVSVATIAPDLMRLGRPDDRRQIAPWLAVGYAVCAGVAAWRIAGTPYLPALPTTASGLGVALVPLVPLVWLAAVDVCSAASVVFPAARSRARIGPERLLVTSIATSVVIWSAHFARSVVRAVEPTGPGEWIPAAVWTLALTVNGFMLAFALLAAVTSASARFANALAVEFAVGTVLLGAAIGEFFRRLVFRSLALQGHDPVWLSLSVGAALAAVWAGLMLRHATVREGPTTSGIGLLLPSWPGHPLVTPFLVAGVPVAAFAAIGRVEQTDWDFVAQRAVALLECGLTFGLLLGVTRRYADAAWSLRRVVAPPCVALALLYAMPTASRAFASATQGQALPADVLLDRYTSSDPVFGLLARALVTQPEADASYFKDVLRSSQRSLETPTVVPAVDFSLPLAPTRHTRPHLFVFVMDSLRRDYVSPHNPAVRFTPNIDGWARGSYVFQNSFTRYGGTLLAIPSIWVGGEVPRAWGRIPFDRVNALGKLVAANGYRTVINDYTVERVLRPDPERVFLDPGGGSPASDFCSQVEGLRQVLAAPDPRPIFAFLAPMNLHLLSTVAAPQAPDAADVYQGFNPGYAAKLQRVDRCFGVFLRDLAAARLDDESVIVLTSDHGDSLGEGGNWGHSSSLFPEVVRIPLIIGLPARLRQQVTTDLSRVAFSTDVTPTLYQLLGYEVRDLGPYFGAPLFTAHDRVLPDRRRESYRLVSSYSPNFALLRRNGRQLYISDLVSTRDYAFELEEPVGRRTALGDAVRRVNQSLIRDQAQAFLARYLPSR